MTDDHADKLTTPLAEALALLGNDKDIDWLTVCATLTRLGDDERLEATARVILLSLSMALAEGCKAASKSRALALSSAMNSMGRKLS